MVTSRSLPSPSCALDWPPRPLPHRRSLSQTHRQFLPPPIQTSDRGFPSLPGEPPKQPRQFTSLLSPPRSASSHHLANHRRDPPELPHERADRSRTIGLLVPTSRFRPHRWRARPGARRFTRLERGVASHSLGQRACPPRRISWPDAGCRRKRSCLVQLSPHLQRRAMRYCPPPTACLLVDPKANHALAQPRSPSGTYTIPQSPSLRSLRDTSFLCCPFHCTYHAFRDRP